MRQRHPVQRRHPEDERGQPEPSGTADAAASDCRRISITHGTGANQASAVHSSGGSAAQQKRAASRRQRQGRLPPRGGQLRPAVVARANPRRCNGGGGRERIRMALSVGRLRSFAQIDSPATARTPLALRSTSRRCGRCALRPRSTPARWHPPAFASRPIPSSGAESRSSRRRPVSVARGDRSAASPRCV